MSSLGDCVYTCNVTIFPYFECTSITTFRLPGFYVSTYYSVEMRREIPISGIHIHVLSKIEFY